ncbi:alpha/beta fold hydrolase [Pseudomonas aeruginosa]|uniref:alpha/beta fold hydrolase n=1 Tax=Pseudomonas aeruginosa TaxID=287 RepID=UPI000AE001D3|nr:alpha/beta hydrolase [Pseudomonas aeruginosa]
MSGALLVSGFFLRRSAWSVEGAGWRSCDHLRDAPGCDLAHWLDQAAATLAGEERVILCGHSFGGYLAQCLAARLGERAAHLYLFSALVSEGGGALESYQDSGQDNLLGLCRLDPLGGRVRLEDRAGFLELLGAEVPTSASERPPTGSARRRCNVPSPTAWTRECGNTRAGTSPHWRTRASFAP